MIQTHLYAKNAVTSIFNCPNDDGKPLIRIPMGNWMGVLEYMDDWIRVLTIGGEGWVKANETECRPHFQLHARWNIAGIPEYINTNNGDYEDAPFE